MDAATLKRLAYLTVENASVSPEVVRFFDERMVRADRKKFLMYLLQAWKRRQVLVRVAGKMDPSATRMIETLYPGKDIRYEDAPALGGGLQIELDDTIIDVNVRRSMETIVQRIKDSL